VDGDIVTDVNGQALSDVAKTIQLLNTLKQETRVQITYLRGGAQQNLELVVE